MDIGPLKDSTTFHALFDSGAAVSLMSAPCFQKFKEHGCVLQKLDASTIPNVHDASGSNMNIVGAYIIKFYFNGSPCTGPFIVSSSLVGNTIIGMNIIQKYDLQLDPLSLTVHIGGRVSVSEVATDGTNISNWKIIVAEKTSIDPQEAKRVKCHIVSPSGE
jgi:hypothetical protein